MIMVRFMLFLLAVALPVVLKAQSVKVMTYNIRFDNPRDGVNAWGNRKEKVFKLLEQYNPDILGVQEAVHSQMLDFGKQLTAYSYVGIGRDDGKEKGEYTAIFFKKDRFELLEQNTFWLSETPDQPGSKNWDASITRIATWAKLRDRRSGKTFLMMNTHFDHIGKEARKKSAELIKKKVVEISQGLPTIVTGDFNCTHDEAAYEEMINGTTITLIDSAPADSPGTYCTFKVGAPCKVIDYIFHTPDWTTSGYKVIQDNDGEHYPSDHLPVIVELTRPEK